MCRISYNAEVSPAVATATGTVLTVNPAQHVKSTFRFRPFRKVAKSARVNLNRYWGLLSQSSAMKPQSPASLPVPNYSVEEEQNRINELLEARNAAAIIENARNFFYESSPEFSRHYYAGSMSSVATSCDSEYAVSTISRGSLV